MSFTEFQTNLSENITKREKLPKKKERCSYTFNYL